jgi:Ca-activated chloride channel family protein
VKRAVLIVCAGLALAAVRAPAQSGKALLREGNRLYEKKQYPDAEVDYRKALESAEHPTTSKFNLGDALYQQGRYDEAAGQYESAVTAAESPDVRAKAYHNLGNALLKGKKLQESVDAYEQSLKLNPKDDDTRYNLEYAKRLLQQQQQQQQQQKKDDKKDKQDKKDNKDQQNKEDQQKQDRRNDRQKDSKEPPRQPKDQISKADAERILDALKQQEQDVKKKLQKKVPVRVKVDKDW